MTDIKSYSVGYGKPPNHSKFKKGQSGHPAGRPRGSLNFDKSLRDSFYETVLVKERGQSKRMTKFEIAIKQHVKNAMLGDLKAIEVCLSILREHDKSRIESPKEIRLLPILGHGGE
jgi:Family of unknown function (DUF5681)